jgi:hypothetical protein
MNADQLGQLMPPIVTHDNAWLAWNLLDTHYQAEVAKITLCEFNMWGNAISIENTSMLPYLPYEPCTEE